jgi:hypothetical protein
MKASLQFLALCVLISGCRPNRAAESPPPPGQVGNSATAAPRSSPCSTAQQYFEFQVEREARFVAEDVSPRPASDASSANLVQVVVDTAGVPDLVTLRVLRAADTALVRAAITAAARWRFTPAMIGGRKVCQLVQTPVQR